MVCFGDNCGPRNQGLPTFPGFCIQVSPNFCGLCPSPTFVGKMVDECMCVQASEVKPPCHVYVVVKKGLACKAGEIQQRFQCQAHSISLLQTVRSRIFSFFLLHFLFFLFFLLSQRWKEGVSSPSFSFSPLHHFIIWGLFIILMGEAGLLVYYMYPFVSI